MDPEPAAAHPVHTAARQKASAGRSVTPGAGEAFIAH